MARTGLRTTATAPWRTPAVTATVAACVTACVAACVATCVAGCGAHTRPVLAQPPTVASAPSSTVRPAGTVVAVAAERPEGIAFDSARGSVVLAGRDGVVLELSATGAVVARYVLPGSARHVRVDGTTVLVPLEDDASLARIDLADGTSSETAVGAGPHDATPLPGGRALVASEQGGRASVVGPDGTVTQTLPCGVQPATVVADGTWAACVDVRGQTLYRFDVTAGRPAVPAGSIAVGSGPTHVVDLGDGLVAVADALGDDIDLVSLPRLTVVGQVRLAASPEGLAADVGRHRLWVTTPGTNQLVRIDLTGGGGRVATTVPSVGQPNSVAVDPGSGAVYVLGATPSGALEILPAQQAGADS